MIDTEFLNDLRRFEMEKLAHFIPKGSRVLEFGSGTGEQAKYLSELGFDVIALDLASSGYAAERVYPVQDYDGRHIPLEDHSVDVIFSSNVMEHVENLPEILAEFRRVLRPGGVAVHAVPTPWWRLWTFASGPPASLQAINRLIRSPRARKGPGSRPLSAADHFKAIVAPWIPIGHGTSREGISELWTFSSVAWRRTFERNGWRVEHLEPLGIFYTGWTVLGTRVSFARREKLSGVFGSAAQLFVLRPAEDRA
jgi:SAM-dependent methyltransferase